MSESDIYTIFLFKWCKLSESGDT